MTQGTDLSTAISSSTPAPAPRRELGLSGLVGLTFFCVAGGAYGLEDAVGAGGPLATIVGILLLPWLWSLPTALMTAELSAAMPEDGGYVHWVKRAFGRFWAFQEGWLSWLCSFADNALYPVMFVDYLAYLRGDMSPMDRWLVGTSVVAAVTWLNLRGIRLVGMSSIVFTLFVLAPFVTLAVIGLPQATPVTWLESTANIEWPLLLSVLLWNTSGWDNAACCAGAVKNPQRAYPRAMIATVWLVTLAYLLPTAAATGVAADWSVWKEGYFPKIAAQLAGNWLGIWLTIAGLVAAVGLFNALLCTSARVPFAMARYGMLPKIFAADQADYQTPWLAILVNSMGVTLLLPFSFQELIEVDMFLYAAALLLEFAALIRLRLTRPEMARPYRIPGGTAGVTLLSLPPMALCVISIVISNTATKYVGLIAAASGVAIYAARVRRAPEMKVETAAVDE
jgi:amino acid transporter